jgi:hypothetical protein
VTLGYCRYWGMGYWGLGQVPGKGESILQQIVLNQLCLVIFPTQRAIQ